MPNTEGKGDTGKKGTPGGSNAGMEVNSQAGKGPYKQSVVHTRRGGKGADIRKRFK